MSFDKQKYSAAVKHRAARSPVMKNCAAAFLVGGAICAAGQLLLALYECFLSQKLAATAVTVTLILAAALLTLFGVFDNIARFAGAGTLLPVTGFANSVVSPAIDTKSEGLILGVGAKIFTIAGPVLLYAILAGTIYGVIYYTATLFM